MVVRKRVVKRADGTYILVNGDDVSPHPSPHPSLHWWQKCVGFYVGFDILQSYVNIHQGHERLRLWGHARIIVFLPQRWRLTWTWMRGDRWPGWEWECFNKG